MVPPAGGGGGRGGSRGRGKPRRSRGRGRRIATADEVVARNEEYERREREEDEESEEGEEASEKTDKKQPSHGEKQSEEEEESESSSEEEEPPANVRAGFSTYNPNYDKRSIEKTGVEISRRAKEQLNRQNRDRKMDALRAAGMTDRSRADLERLAEVRRRREEAAKLREEEMQQKKQAEEEKLSQKMGRVSLTGK